MSLKKTWLGTLAVITVVLLLGACGGKKESIGTGEKPINDNSQNHTVKDFMPLSEGLEKYPVWFKTDVYQNRNSGASEIYVFENGNVTGYKDFGGLSIEKINNLTDDQIIKYVKENSTIKSTGKYTLDITLDELGHYTKEIKVLFENGTREFFYPKGFNLDGEILTEDKTTTEKIDSLLTFRPEPVNQKIFDTTYSGLGYDEYNGLFTRVDDSFVGFKLDDPDTKSKNVTIEGE